MRRVRVLHGEVVQSESLLDGAQQLLVRLVQADPDEAAVPGLHGAGALEVYVRDPAPAFVGGAVDHDVVARDPQGNQFGLWQAGVHTGYIDMAALKEGEDIIEPLAERIADRPGGRRPGGASLPRLTRQACCRG